MKLLHSIDSIIESAILGKIGTLGLTGYGTVQAAKALANLNNGSGMNNNPNIATTKTISDKPVSAGLVTKNPWKMDNQGHVAGTKLSPSAYNNHLATRFGVHRANAAINRASGIK